MRTRRHRSTAQTLTEYMLVISVIVIALAAVVYDPMQSAMKQGSKKWRDQSKVNSEMGFTGDSYKQGERR